MDRTIEDSQTFLSVAETAAVLGVSKAWVYGAVEADELPALRLGSGPKALIRIDREDLRSYLCRDRRDAECAPQLKASASIKSVESRPVRIATFDC